MSFGVFVMGVFGGVLGWELGDLGARRHSAHLAGLRHLPGDQKYDILMAEMWPLMGIATGREAGMHLCHDSGT